MTKLPLTLEQMEETLCQQVAKQNAELWNNKLKSIIGEWINPPYPYPVVIEGVSLSLKQCEGCYGIYYYVEANHYKNGWFGKVKENKAKICNSQELVKIIKTHKIACCRGTLPILTDSYTKEELQQALEELDGKI